MLDEAKRRTWTAISLAVLYSVWGSTYLAQRIAIRTLPPLSMAGIRFVASGAILYAISRALGAPRPSLRASGAAALAAIPLLVLGMGTAAVAVGRAPSGLVALVFTSVPIWTALAGVVLGEKVRRREALGLALGLAGVVLVGARGSLRADPASLALALGAAASYAAGLHATRRLPLPKGTMGTAVQMTAGGLMLLPLGALMGERITTPSAESLASLAYLVLFGSVAAYSALGFLLRHARPALATSYAYVNPPVALALGALLGDEHFRRADVVGLAVVLAGVALIASDRPDPTPRDEVGPLEIAGARSRAAVAPLRT